MHTNDFRKTELLEIELFDHLTVRKWMACLTELYGMYSNAWKNI